MAKKHRLWVVFVIVLMLSLLCTAGIGLILPVDSPLLALGLRKVGEGLQKRIDWALSATVLVWLIFYMGLTSAGSFSSKLAMIARKIALPLTGLSGVLHGLAFLAWRHDYPDWHIFLLYGVVWLVTAAWFYWQALVDA